MVPKFPLAVMGVSNPAQCEVQRPQSLRTPMQLNETLQSQYSIITDAQHFECYLCRWKKHFATLPHPSQLREELFRTQYDTNKYVVLADLERATDFDTETQMTGEFYFDAAIGKWQSA